MLKKPVRLILHLQALALAVAVFALMVWALLCLTGCSPAPVVKDGSDAASVKCYSGGVLFYEGESTGLVYQYNTGFIVFDDVATGRSRSVRGDCLVTSLSPPDSRPSTPRNGPGS